MVFSFAKLQRVSSGSCSLADPVYEQRIPASEFFFAKSMQVRAIVIARTLTIVLDAAALKRFQNYLRPVSVQKAVAYEERFRKPGLQQTSKNLVALASIAAFREHIIRRPGRFY